MDVAGDGASTASKDGVQASPGDEVKLDDANS